MDLYFTQRNGTRLDLSSDFSENRSMLMASQNDEFKKEKDEEKSGSGDHYVTLCAPNDLDPKVKGVL